MSKLNEMQQRVHSTLASVKNYWIIFPKDGPATITESERAANYWRNKGNVVETYQRIIYPEVTKHEQAHHHRGCCNVHPG